MHLTPFGNSNKVEKRLILPYLVYNSMETYHAISTAAGYFAQAHAKQRTKEPTSLFQTAQFRPRAKDQVGQSLGMWESSRTE